ncbi:MAG: DNA mismatch repair endonuclease MutL [Chloroflexi bacterium]|nr:DNA mismatch repair endonuclease MutL [Chloroflexota bacterium]
MPIQVLSPTVAAQIAAGEVVERPASVVKELLENALDAGASSVDVEIRGAGRQLIRVRDNGYGIPEAEISLALQRHATSKINAIDDLASLHTLGFRGEALHSIASVSRMTLTSCHQQAQKGARLVVEGGEVQDMRGVGAPPGTVVEVADLFYNVPARRKFLKSDATERRHIVTVVSQYAMAYPDVRFQLVVDGREMFHSTGSGDLADVLIAVLGLETFREMVEVVPLPPMRADLSPIEVYGFTTTPHLHRANRYQIHLFVNGRLISDQRLTYAVVQAYHTLLPSGRYPLAVLMITIPPDEVDVNVHPTKAEVRFRSPDAVFSAVQRAVRRAIVDRMDVPAARYGSDASTSPGAHDTESAVPVRPRPLGPIETSPVSNQQLDLDIASVSPGRYSQQIDPDEYDTRDEEDRYYPHFEAATPPHLARQDSEESPDDPTALPDRMGSPQRPRTLPILRVIGQVAATYIVAEGPAGMYLIDQHAAHERILYEQFMAAYQAQEIVVQQVLETMAVDLGPMEARVLDEVQEALIAVGFEIEPFGKNTYRIRAVPAILADRDPADVFLELLQDAESGREPGAQAIEAKIVRRVCKAAAVKAGQILSHAEMQGLMRQLERCQNPHTCPHGRPTLIHLSNDVLEREFGRS